MSAKLLCPVIAKQHPQRRFLKGITTVFLVDIDDTDVHGLFVAAGIGASRLLVSLQVRPRSDGELPRIPSAPTSVVSFLPISRAGNLVGRGSEIGGGC